MTGRRRGAAAQARPGFTLIEVVLVMAILALVAALVLPVVGRGSQKLRLRSEAGRVAALLRAARQEAVSQRHTTRVRLDPRENAVALTTDDPEDTPRQVTLPQDIQMTVAAGSEALSFSPRGITRQTRWVLEGPGGQRLAVAVEALSGRVTVRPEGRS